MTNPADGRPGGRTAGARTAGVATDERRADGPGAARDPVRQGTSVGWAQFLVPLFLLLFSVSQMAFVTSDTHPLASLSAGRGVDAASASLGRGVAELLGCEGELFRHSGTTRTRT